MVDVADFTQINNLMAESQSIGAALDALTAGGRIIRMLVEREPRTPDMPDDYQIPWVMVLTQGMDYPPQMVTSIKNALTARQGDIAKALADMGVTDTNQRKGK